MGESPETAVTTQTFAKQNGCGTVTENSNWKGSIKIFGTQEQKYPR